jgi:hypothetical protein
VAGTCSDDRVYQTHYSIQHVTLITHPHTQCLAKGGGEVGRFDVRGIGCACSCIDGQGSRSCISVKLQASPFAQARACRG